MRSAISASRPPGRSAKLATQKKGQREQRKKGSGQNLSTPGGLLTIDTAVRVPGIPTEFSLQTPTTAGIYKPSVSPLPAKGRPHSSHYRFTRGVRNNRGRFFRSVKEVASVRLAASGTIFEQIVPGGHSRSRLDSRQERPQVLRAVSPARRLLLSALFSRYVQREKNFLASLREFPQSNPKFSV